MMCTMPASRSPIRNPIRAYKDRHELTYLELAKRLGCSWDYARKLGAGLVLSVSAPMAKRFDRRTRGELAFMDVMAWVGDQRRPRRRAR